MRSFGPMTRRVEDPPSSARIMPHAEEPRQRTALTAEDALKQAVAHHRGGRLEEAECVYRAILRDHPEHPDANHNLGVLAAQTRQPEAGLPYFKAAWQANPKAEQYWLSYMDALLRSGQTDVAREALTQGIELGLHGPAVEAMAAKLVESPRSEPGGQEIKMIAEMFAEGRYVETASLALELTERFPLHGFGWKVLGAALMQTGRTSEALVPMQRAAGLMPRDANAHSNLAAVLQELGQLEGAAASCCEALKSKPDHSEAHLHLGNVLKELGRLNDAATSYGRALVIKPTYPAAHSNLGNVLKDLGQFDGAIASCREALKVKADYAAAHTNLGNSLRELGRLDEAVASYSVALSLKPDLAEAHSNLGNSLKELGRLDDAATGYGRALVIRPTYAAAYLSLIHI